MNAHLRGYLAALDGLAAELNPFTPRSLRWFDWLRGWRAGAKAKAVARSLTRERMVVA